MQQLSTKKDEKTFYNTQKRRKSNGNNKTRETDKPKGKSWTFLVYTTHWLRRWFMVFITVRYD